MYVIHSGFNTVVGLTPGGVHCLIEVSR
jgi:hypothetical protein